jgi:hypothetical protein
MWKNIKGGDVKDERNKNQRGEKKSKWRWKNRKQIDIR